MCELPILAILDYLFGAFSLNNALSVLPRCIFASLYFTTKDWTQGTEKATIKIRSVQKVSVLWQPPSCFGCRAASRMRPTAVCIS